MEEEERKSTAFGLIEPSEDPSAVATIGIADCRLPSEQPAKTSERKGYRYGSVRSNSKVQFGPTVRFTLVQQ